MGGFALGLVGLSWMKPQTQPLAIVPPGPLPANRSGARLRSLGVSVISSSDSPAASARAGASSFEPGIRAEPATAVPATAADRPISERRDIRSFVPTIVASNSSILGPPPLHPSVAAVETLYECEIERRRGRPRQRPPSHFTARHRAYPRG